MKERTIIWLNEVKLRRYNGSDNLEIFIKRENISNILLVDGKNCDEWKETHS